MVTFPIVGATESNTFALPGVPYAEIHASKPTFALAWYQFAPSSPSPGNAIRSIEAGMILFHFGQGFARALSTTIAPFIRTRLF